MGDEDEAPAEEAREIDFICNRPGGLHQHELILQVNAPERFLAKLALGFSQTLLGDATAQSPYADELRRLLWQIRPDEEPQPAVRGNGFWRELGNADAERFLGIEGAWTLNFKIIGGDFVLVVSTPKLRCMSIVVSDDESLWPADIRDRFGDGITYVILPQRQRCFGPFEFGEFLAHRLGDIECAGLAAIDNLREGKNNLPPKYID